MSCQNFSDNHLKIGLVGFGFMGKTHLYAVENLKFFTEPQALGCSAEISSVSTSREETAIDAANRYAIPRPCASEDEIINDPDIDIIDVCSPNNAHIGTIKKAIANGKHVICEKPLTATLDEAHEAVLLEREARERGLVTATVFNNRYLSPVIRACQIISEGGIGDILSFTFTYYHDSCIDPSRRAGWKQNADFGGGTLADLGPHVIDLCHLLVGRIKSISATSQIAFPTHEDASGALWETNADEAFYMTCKAECGAVGSINVSKIAHGSSDGLAFEIYGTKGALRFSLMDMNYLYFYDASSPQYPAGGNRGWTRIECVGRYPSPAGTFPSVKAPAGWLRGHVGCMAAFLHAVASTGDLTADNLDGCLPPPSFADGAAVMSVIAAAKESDSKNGAFVGVEYF